MCINRNTIVFWIGLFCLVFQHRRLTFILLNLQMLIKLDRKDVNAIYQSTKCTLERSFSSSWQNSSDVQLLKNMVKLGEINREQMFIKQENNIINNNGNNTNGNTTTTTMVKHDKVVNDEKHPHHLDHVI